MRGWGGTAGASRARAGKSTVGFEIQDEETLGASSSSEEFDGNADYRHSAISGLSGMQSEQSVMSEDDGPL